MSENQDVLYVRLLLDLFSGVDNLSLGVYKSSFALLVGPVLTGNWE